MKLHELLDVIGASYNDVDLRYYKLMAKVGEDESYNVRGVWLDHKKRTISFSLTCSKQSSRSSASSSSSAHGSLLPHRKQ